MADPTLKAQIIAFKLVLATEKLMEGVHDFENILSEYQNSGIQFTDAMFQTTFTNPLTGQQVNLTHLDKATAETAGVKFIALATWMKDVANGASVAFDKVVR